MDQEEQLKPGDTVDGNATRSARRPSWEDQRAICEAVGKPVQLIEYEKDGREELEFRSTDGVIHFIYMNPNFIRAAK
jgi:hypothetical protein